MFVRAAVTVTVFCIGNAIAAQTPSKIKVAIEVTESLDERRNELVKAEQSVREAIDRISIKSFEGDLSSLAALRSYVVILRSELHLVIKSHEHYIVTAESFVEGHLSAATALAQIGHSFSQYAQEQEYADLKESYETISKAFFILAERLRDFGENAIDPHSIQVVKESLQYVQQNKIFLHRFSRALSVLERYDGATPEPVLARVASYATKFEQLRELVQSFHHRLMSVESIRKEIEEAKHVVTETELNATPPKSEPKSDTTPQSGQAPAVVPLDAQATSDVRSRKATTVCGALALFAGTLAAWRRRKSLGAAIERATCSRSMAVKVMSSTAPLPPALPASVLICEQPKQD